MIRGLFVTFEGIDGCGKTTQLALAKKALEQKGVRCLATREPGGTGIGEKIRELLLSPQHGEMCDRCELLLYLAARSQHVHEVIVPAMENDMVVLCDRFADATVAYQAFGRGLPLDALKKLNEFAAAGLSPSLTFIFDLSVESAQQRLIKSGKAADRLEGCGAQFQEKVRKGYLSLAAEFPRRVVVVGAERPIEELSTRVVDTISKFLDQ